MYASADARQQQQQQARQLARVPTEIRNDGGKLVGVGREQDRTVSTCHFTIFMMQTEHPTSALRCTGCRYKTAHLREGVCQELQSWVWCVKAIGGLDRKVA